MRSSMSGNSVRLEQSIHQVLWGQNDVGTSALIWSCTFLMKAWTYSNPGQPAWATTSIQCVKYVFLWRNSLHPKQKLHSTISPLHCHKISLPNRQNGMANIKCFNQLLLYTIVQKFLPGWTLRIFHLPMTMCPMLWWNLWQCMHWLFPNPCLAAPRNVWRPWLSAFQALNN